MIDQSPSTKSETGMDVIKNDGGRVRNLMLRVVSKRVNKWYTHFFLSFFSLGTELG